MVFLCVFCARTRLASISPFINLQGVDEFAAKLDNLQLKAQVFLLQQMIIVRAFISKPQFAP